MIDEIRYYIHHCTGIINHYEEMRGKLLVALAEEVAKEVEDE